MAETVWGAMMRTAVAMGIAPEAFWRLSLREWRMLTAGPAGVVPMGRRALDEMIRAWPDSEPSPFVRGRRM